MTTAHVHIEQILDADPDAVLRLVTEIGQWPALLPHVHQTVALDGGRWVVRFAWHGLPLRATCVQSSVPEAGEVVQRFIAGRIVRIAVRWDIRGTTNQRTRLWLDARPDGGSRLLGRLALRVVVVDLLTRTLEMVRLLAQSDRKAHAGIE